MTARQSVMVSFGRISKLQTLTIDASTRIDEAQSTCLFFIFGEAQSVLGPTMRFGYQYQNVIIAFFVDWLKAEAIKIEPLYDYTSPSNFQLFRPSNTKILLPVLVKFP